MGINQINLSPEVISSLYPESLVPVGNKAVTPMGNGGRETAKKPGKSPEKKPEFEFLGGNLRNICFLVESSADAFLSASQQLFLEKILLACKCTMADIAIVNLAKNSVRLADLRSQLNPSILYLWGVTTKQAGIKEELPDFTICLIDGMSVIAVSSTELMAGTTAEGTELKKRLWATLKKLFNL